MSLNATGGLLPGFDQSYALVACFVTFFLQIMQSLSPSTHP